MKTAMNFFCPILEEDMTFCESPDCGEIASWKCYPADSLTCSMTLCDRCKQEMMRETLADLQVMREDLGAMRALLLSLLVNLLIIIALGLIIVPFLLVMIPLSIVALVAYLIGSLLER